MSNSAELNAGDKAPTFALPDQTGESRALKDFKGRWLVVYFYPKDDTPGCTTEALEFTEKLPEFTAADCAVVGISPDDDACHKKFAEKHNLAVTLLADPKKSTIEKFGAWGTKKLYGKEIVGVLRTTFLVNPNGKIAEIWRNVRAKGHAEKVLIRLRELQAE